MTRSVVTTHPYETLSEIADLLIRTKISGLPVVGEESKIVGIVTATDLFSVMSKIREGLFMEKERKANVNPTVEEVMIKNVTTISDDHNLLDVVNIMCTKNIHTLPVIKEEKLIGVIGRRDVMMYFYAAVRDSVEEFNQSSLRR
jgi:CBS domain-containing protein